MQNKNDSLIQHPIPRTQPPSINFDNIPNERLIDINELLITIGMKSKTTVYEMVKRGELPPPRRIGPRCSRWIFSEVIRCIYASPQAPTNNDNLETA